MKDTSKNFIKLKLNNTVNFRFFKASALFYMQDHGRYLKHLFRKAFFNARIGISRYQKMFSFCLFFPH